MEWSDPQADQTNLVDALGAHGEDVHDEEDQKWKPGGGEHQRQVGLLLRCLELQHAPVPTGGSPLTSV